MKGAIVEQEQMEGGRISRSEVSKEELKALGIKDGQFQKEALPRQRFHCAVQVETLEAVGRREEGVDAAGRDAAADDGQESATTLILSPHAPLLIAALLGRLDLGQEPRAQRVLEV